ncbi:MAG: hypothetical protein IJX14_12555, partial [Clostridia bacterium]|nr:hypothetical protein [Clostridia bacterium]
MVEAVIKKNLQMFQSRSVISSVPTGEWEYRIAEYREREDYVMLTDWAPLSDSVMFHTTKTFFGRMTFTPTAPSAGQTAFLELRTGGGCEAFVKVNGTYYAGVNADQGRVRVYLLPETWGKETEIGIEEFASHHAHGERDVKPVQSCRWVIVDDDMADFAHGMNLLWNV